MIRPRAPIADRHSRRLAVLVVIVAMVVALLLVALAIMAGLAALVLFAGAGALSLGILVQSLVGRWHRIADALAGRYAKVPVDGGSTGAPVLLAVAGRRPRAKDAQPHPSKVQRDARHSTIRIVRETGL